MGITWVTSDKIHRDGVEIASCRQAQADKTLLSYPVALRVNALTPPAVLKQTIETSSATPACVCGHTEFSILGPCRRPSITSIVGFEAELSEQVDPGHLLRCLKCSLVVRSPRPDVAKLETLYEQMPQNRWETSISVPQTEALKFLKPLIARKKSLNVLDVGAYSGGFLKALPEGVDRAAIEPSSSAQRELQQSGIRIVASFLKDISSDNSNEFDAVTMFDVFEHLPDPLEGMRTLYSMVRPGGALIIGTANFDHWTFRCLRGRHWYLDPIQHIAVGSPRNIQWMAEQMGARITRLCRCSHQPSDVFSRLLESLEVCYFNYRGTDPVSRIVTRFFHLFPFFRRMSHRTYPGYLMKLNDHMMVVLEKPLSTDSVS